MLHEKKKGNKGLKGKKIAYAISILDSSLRQHNYKTMPLDEIIDANDDVTDHQVKHARKAL